MAALALAAAIALGAMVAVSAVAGDPPAGTLAPVTTMSEQLPPAYAPAEAAVDSGAAAGAQTVTAYVQPSAGIAIGADGQIADASNVPVAISRDSNQGVETVSVIPR